MSPLDSLRSGALIPIHDFLYALRSIHRISPHTAHYTITLSSFFPFPPLSTLGPRKPAGLRRVSERSTTSPVFFIPITLAYLTSQGEGGAYVCRVMIKGLPQGLACVRVRLYFVTLHCL